MGKLKSLLTGLALGTLVGALLDPERRRETKKLLQELKSKVRERAKNLTDVSREAYEKMVEATAAEYKEMKSLSEKELAQITQELKNAWEDIKASLKK